MDSPRQRVDTLIIGAGLSGIRTASLLEASGHTVRILEAKERVGGRILSQRFAGGTVDMGAQWVGPHQTRILNLLTALNMRTFPTVHSGRKVLALGSTVRTYGGSIPKMSPFALLELQRTIVRLDRLIHAGTPIDAHVSSAGREQDQYSMGEWARKHIWQSSVRTVLNAVIRVVFGVEMNEVSMLHFLMYCRAGGGLMNLCEIEGAAQEQRIIGGAQTIVQRLADSVQGPIHLNTPVVRMRYDHTGVEVETATGSYSAERVVVTIPPPLMSKVECVPPLPLDRQQVQSRMPMGGTIKCMVAYRTPFWKNAGYSGEVVADGHPLTVVFDNTTEEGIPVLLGFIVGRPAREWGRRDADARRCAVIAALTRYFGPDAGCPVDYLEKDWAAEPYTSGCPIAVPAPGMWVPHGDAVRKSIGPVYWAGTETATEWMGFMEGALQSAERVTHEILEGIR